MGLHPATAAMSAAGGYGYGCLDPERGGGGYVNLDTLYNLDTATQHAIGGGSITSKIAGPM